MQQNHTNTSTNNNQDQSTENETNDSQPKGDVGMDTDQQQKNIDAAKAAQENEEREKYDGYTREEAKQKIIEDAHGDFPGGISADQFGENVLNQW
ncbi:hypothetical protein ACUXP2_000881 [Staphylococcus haemolyticus]